VTSGRRPIDRRVFLTGLVAAAGVACTRTAGGAPGTSAATGSAPPATGGLPGSLILPTDPEVAAAEARRAGPGAAVRSTDVRALVGPVALGGRTVETWRYGRAPESGQAGRAPESGQAGRAPESGGGDDGVPGPLLRATAGDVLQVRLANDLPEDTTIHWHGLALRNDMDGVHHLTQDPIRAGDPFTYRFAVPTPGTYWYHSHHGLQADRGLYGPLVIDDPAEPGAYDVEHVIVLDDWIDGVGGTPHDVADALMCHDGCRAPSPLLARFRSPALGGDAGDIAYPLHLLNGRPIDDAPTLAAPPGGRARLRIINAAAETAYRVGWPGLSAVVTHSDGYPVAPVPTDGLLIAMGERYDVVVTVPSGAWPLIAEAEGKDARCGAVLRTPDAVTTAVDLAGAPRPDDAALLTYDRLRATDGVRLPFDRPDVEHVITLTGRAANYHWGIEGLPYPDNAPIVVHPDERVRLVIQNTTNMWHPIHLHGHTFRLGGSPDGPRKDTVIVKPGESPVFDVVCDNPGRWMLHCHNAYHLEAGMAIGVDYHR